ncbi:hypothetical protein GCM10009730_67200 [Streptomyces albidochromogenes]
MPRFYGAPGSLRPALPRGRPRPLGIPMPCASCTPAPGHPDAECLLHPPPPWASPCPRPLHPRRRQHPQRPPRHLSADWE